MKITQKISTIRKLASPYFKAYALSIMTVVVMSAVLMTVPGILADIFIKDDNLYAAVVQAYSLIIAGPLTFGQAILFLSAFRNQCAGLNSLGYGFQYSNKALTLLVFIYFRTLLGLIFFVVPGIIAILKYSLAFYVLADNPNWTPKACMNESVRLMTGNKMKFVKLALSYVPFLVLSAVPRIAVTYALLDLPMVITEKTLAMAWINAWNTPISVLFGLLILIPEAQMSVAFACFYDISSEKLVFEEENKVTECAPTVA